MKQLTRADILENKDYLQIRNQRRSEMIELKKKRRIQVGPRISFTFENRETVAYQIQEMMRVEYITDPERIQFEIDVYNDLIPQPGSLSATLFIEISDSSQIRTVLDSLQGLDAPDTVVITIGEDKVFAEFEPGHSKEDRISAVHYVRFLLTPDQIRRFLESQVEIRIKHPAYTAVAALMREQKEQLSSDLTRQ